MVFLVTIHHIIFTTSYLANQNKLDQIVEVVTRDLLSKSPFSRSITPILPKVYEKLVSHKLSSFCNKCSFLPAAQFAYRKDLGCTDAMLTISHHLHKSLDTEMESYIVQFDFSAAFNRVSHSGLLFK